MSLNESIIEDAALERFLLRPALRDYGGQVGNPLSPRLRRTGLGYAVGHWPHLAPGEYAEGTPNPAISHGEREKSEAIRRLKPPMPAASLTRPFPKGEERGRGQLVSVTYKFEWRGD